MATLSTDKAKATMRHDVQCPKCWGPLQVGGDELDGQTLMCCTKCNHVYTVDAAGVPHDPTPVQNAAIHEMATATIKELIPVLDKFPFENRISAIAAVLALYITEETDNKDKIWATFKTAAFSCINLLKLAHNMRKVYKGAYRDLLLSKTGVPGDSASGGGDGGGSDAVGKPEKSG